eukprot:5247753-Alexandrium_andersonii.AAC.1
MEVAEELAEVFADAVGVLRAHLQEVPHAAAAGQPVSPLLFGKVPPGQLLLLGDTRDHVDAALEALKG